MPGVASFFKNIVSSTFVGTIPVRSSNGVLVIAIVCSVLAFLPVYLIKSSGTGGSIGNEISSAAGSINDDNFSSYFRNEKLQGAALASLIITIPSSVDILVDAMPSKLVEHILGIDERGILRKATEGSSLRFLHLDMSEWASFVIGMVCLSSIAFDSVENYSAVSKLYWSFQNASTILTICPLISYLSRNSRLWPPAWSYLLTVLVCLGTLLCSAYLMLPGSSEKRGLLGDASCYVMTIAAGLYVIFYVGSLLHYCWGKWRNKGADSRNARKVADENFRDFIVGMHMTTLLIQLVVTVNWYWFFSALTVTSLTVLIYLWVGAAVLVFVAEFRVRKYEIVSVMFNLLDAKKSYVRYISHELRTPMNTAVLGLKYLIDTATRSNDESSLVLLDTLHDVHTACESAVEILNDLLTFEKLESGILELHKSEVLAVEFVKEGVDMFVVQARAKDITLTLDFAVDPGLRISPRGVISAPLTGTETLLIDKFKMNQVLRNVISNALKFTPSGGSVTVRVTCSEELQEMKSEKTDATRSQRPTSGTTSNRGRGGLRRSTKPRRIVSSSDDLPSLSAGVTTDVAVTGANDGADASANVSTSEVQSKDKQNDNDDSDSIGVVVIEVIDSGAGISAANQKRLFHEIVQFSPEVLQSGGGSGLGLWITKGIVDLHGGSISVFSEGEGKGSTFTVRIPIARASAPQDPMTRQTSTMPPVTRQSSVHPQSRKPSFLLQSQHSARSIMLSVGSSSVSSRKLDQAGVLLDRSSKQSLPFEAFAEKGIESEDKSAAAACGGGPVGSEKTEFSFEQNKDPAARQSGRSDTYNPLAAKNTPKYRVLIVDDSVMNRKMLLKIMRAAGHECEEAEDGLGAVAKVKLPLGDSRPEYDVILMDYVMPNMDGPTATRELRQLGYKGAIFGVTGNGLESDVAHFKSSGANDVLIKPLNYTEFMHAIALQSGSNDNKIRDGGHNGHGEDDVEVFP